MIEYFNIKIISHHTLTNKTRITLSKKDTSRFTSYCLLYEAIFTELPVITAGICREIVIQDCLLRAKLY
jgi:hypothetical protein